MTSDLDPRWEWFEVRRFGDPEPRWIKGPCNHLEIVPVEGLLLSLAQEEGVRPIVAHLCLTCDAQLPAEWTP